MKKSCSEPLTPELQKLVEDNMRYVPIIARRLWMRLPPWASREDLIAAGYLGLVDCAPRFDGRTEFRLFARKRILGAMMDYLRGEDLLTRTERQTQGDAIDRKQVEINDRVHATPEDNVGKLEADIDVRSILRKLRAQYPRHAFVIEQWYLQDRKLREIGVDLGVNESRASQLAIAAIAKMRAAA